MRYYIPVKSFFIITEASYGWQYSKTKYDNWDAVTRSVYQFERDTNKSKGYSLGAGPAFFLSPYTSIEILTNYQSRLDAASTDFNKHIINPNFTLASASRSICLQTKNNEKVTRVNFFSKG